MNKHAEWERGAGVQCGMESDNHLRARLSEREAAYFGSTVRARLIGGQGGQATDSRMDWASIAGRR